MTTGKKDTTVSTPAFAGVDKNIPQPDDSMHACTQSGLPMKRYVEPESLAQLMCIERHGATLVLRCVSDF
jgi:hypothetical protein